MKSDIIPYSKEDCQGMAASLVKVGIPCFGPGTGIELVRISDAVKVVILKMQKKGGMDDICVLLNGYRDRLMDVAFVNAFMQKEVIGQLEKAIKG